MISVSGTSISHLTESEPKLTRCLVPKRHLPSKQARPLGHRAKVGVVSVDSC